MKRLIAALFLTCGAMAGCGPEEPAAPAAAAQSEWSAPPVIDQVAATAEGVRIAGQAAPGARISLIAHEGAAHGATADPQGRFEVNLPVAASPRLFQAVIVHTNGATPAPGWLFVPPGGAAPAALLRPGAGALPIGDSGLIAAFDYDGGAAVASGRAAPGVEVRVSVDGEAAGAARAEADGRYRVQLPPIPPGLRRIRVEAGQDEATADLRLIAPGEATFSAEAQDHGWRVIWPLPGGGAQGTWLILDPAA